MTDRGLERRHAFLTLTHDQVQAIVAPAFPANALLNAEPLTGGKINSNYKLSFKDTSEIAVLRLYARGKLTCQLERDALEHIQGKLPAPTVVYDGTEQDVPFLITSWAPGVLLSTALASSQQDHFSLGKSTGSVLANIHAHTFPKSGFFGKDLNIHTPFPAGKESFLSFIRPALEGRAADRLGSHLTERLQTLINWAAPILDTLPTQACLIHSDFNPPNLMTKDGHISGVLDWEFTHAGNPLTDIANMLRPRDYQPDEFNKGFIEAYELGNGPLPANWQSLSQLIDLMAQVEMLSAHQERPNLFRWACARIASTIDFIETDLGPHRQT